MLRTREKAEIQALSSFGFQYLSQVSERARACTPAAEACFPVNANGSILVFTWVRMCVAHCLPILSSAGLQPAGGAGAGWTRRPNADAAARLLACRRCTCP